DEELRVALVNPAAERLFGDRRGVPAGEDFRALLGDEARARLIESVAELSHTGTASLWIAGGLRAKSVRGRVFHAEATLSRYEVDGRRWLTLILRDVEDRLAAEEKIRSLVRETELLRSELRTLQPFEPIVGTSKALMSALQQVSSVAPTDTTVLLLGETGT